MLWNVRVFIGNTKRGPAGTFERRQFAVKITSIWIKSGCGRSHGNCGDSEKSSNGELP